MKTIYTLSIGIVISLFFIFPMQVHAQNRALNFDGVNDQITVPDNSSLDIASNITIELWVKNDDVTGYETYCNKATDSDWEDGYGLSRDGSRITWYPFGWDDNRLDSPNGILTAGTWHHIAGTYDGVEAKIYLDGTLVATSTVSKVIPTNSLPLNIGNDNDNYPFLGTMDEVRVWSEARTQAQIMANKDIELMGNEAGLVAYYNFSEGIPNANNTSLNAPEVKDKSTNSNNGTMSGFAKNGSTSNWVAGPNVKMKPLVTPAGLGDNLALWLKADAGFAPNHWSDKSGNYNDAVQSSVISQPSSTANSINFNPGITFSNNWMSLTNTPSAMGLQNSDYEAFFIAKSRTGSGNIQEIQFLMGGALEQYEIHLNGAAGLRFIPTTSKYSDLSPTLTYSNNQAYIFGGSVINNIGKASVNGSFTTDTETPSQSASTVELVIGRRGNGSFPFEGEIAEVVIYNEDLSATDRNKLLSYLSIKYGITLDQFTATNYTSSNGSVIWEASALGIYNNDIAGIGRDDVSGLNQKQSKSANNDAIVTIGIGSIANDNVSNANTFAADGRFLVWANNNGAANFASALTTNVPAPFEVRMARSWKIEENNGDTGNTQVKVDLNGLGYMRTNKEHYALLVSNDANFANATIKNADDFTNNVITFNEVNFADGQYFTLAYGDAYIWTGTEWLPGVPNAANDASIQGYLKQETNLTTKSLTIQNNQVLELAANATLDVSGTLNVRGSAIVRSGGSLLLNNPVNGNITFERQGSNKGYSYLSSPISNADYSNLPGPSTFSHEEIRNAEVPGKSENAGYGWMLSRQGAIPVGKGFIEYLPNLFSLTGSPNIGIQNVAVSVTGNGVFSSFNLLGNPYPAAIKLESFVMPNTDLSGTLYFWDAEIQDYRPKNLATGDANYGIASMQGFFTKAVKNGNAQFTHAMRETGNNGNFFRQSAEDIIRLKLTATQGFFAKDLFITFDATFTDDYERMYDAEVFKGNPEFTFFAKHQAQDFSVLALPIIESAREIELGLEAIQTENITLSLVETLNLPADWKVHLKDTESGELYSLNSESEVPLKTSKKYSLVITTKAVTDLIDDFATNAELLVWEQNELLNVWFSNTNIAQAKLRVFTLTGQQVLHTNWETVKQQQLSLQHNLPASQLYIIKIETSEGMFTKKWLR